MKDCGIIKDLLPLVAEDMASEETKSFVNNHLEICEDCRKAYGEMKAPVEAEPAAPLKSMRKTVKKRGWLIAGLIACLVAALLIGAFTRLTKPIALRSVKEAFSDVSIVPETIPVVKETLPESGESDGTAAAPDESEQVKQVQLYIVWVDGMENDGKAYWKGSDADKDFQSIGFTIRASEDADASGEEPSETDVPTVNATIVLEPPKEEVTEGAIYQYSIYDLSTDGTETLKPDAVIVSTPKTLILTANPEVQYIHTEPDGDEISVYAATSLWRQWFQKEREPVKVELELNDSINAVYFEPFDNTEHEVLYQRVGYTPESGFALPRLVMNYYFAIALLAAVVLLIPWLVLLLTKKQKARRVFDVLLLVPLCGTLAFLFAGFPATTIEPLRDMIFVCIIAVLLFGAGLCGRALFRKD